MPTSTWSGRTREAPGQVGLGYCRSALGRESCKGNTKGSAPQGAGVAAASDTSAWTRSAAPRGTENLRLGVPPPASVPPTPLPIAGLFRRCALPKDGGVRSPGGPEPLSALPHPRAAWLRGLLAASPGPPGRRSRG
ncbi:unnamed protein product [Rangifer tarandus platyrhynchus]|uniref:Uncharacterized protein n=2 Tax=Rangifer tarandus platyrhynchus TaxID=3082113 RepID=A0ACB0EDR8_RANTA|nr:unnamed protein product [Rangifer tarandus platyrhynchus]CAI9698805.1 unnamed protein product [Rangifer tarandus platyrhynchus]